MPSAGLKAVGRVAEWAVGRMLQPREGTAWHGTKPGRAKSRAGPT